MMTNIRAREALDPDAAKRLDRPYSSLAPLYDRIMSHVDYEHWADYLEMLIARFAPEPERVLELGCGTGNLTYRLCGRLPANFVATDASLEMLAVAETKMPAAPLNLRFEQLDFAYPILEEQFDVILLAYDGINYLLEADQVQSLFERIPSLLNSGGVFLFDHSTPANSLNNLPYFADQWKGVNQGYARTSDYDAERRIHVTQFDIWLGRKRMREVHYQRAYDVQEMEMMIKLSSLRVEACFDGFTCLPATGESERIQWILSKPKLSPNPLT